MNPTIYQLPTVLAGTVDILPQQKFMVSGDSLDVVTSEGYLNGIDLQVYPVTTSDILQVLYAYDPQTKQGSYGVFTVSMQNGIITLKVASQPGEIILPVTAGHFASWANSTGSLTDSGYLPSSLVSKTVACTASPVNGNIPRYSDLAGTIGAGISPSAATPTRLVSTTGLVTLNGLATFTDINGTVGDGIPVANFVRTNASNIMATNSEILLTRSAVTAGAGNVAASTTQKTAVTITGLSLPPVTEEAFTLNNPLISANSIIDLTVGPNASASGYVGVYVFSLANGSAVMRIINVDAVDTVTGDVTINVSVN